MHVHPMLRLAGVLAAILIATTVAFAARGEPKAAKAVKPDPKTQRYVFAGVPWGTDADVALGLLAERGYRRIERAKGSPNLTAEGDLYNRIAVVRGFVDDSNRVVRWEIVMVGKPGPRKYLEMRELYEEVVAETRSRYGPRKSTDERYTYPYERNDTRELAALAEGMAVIRSEWRAHLGDVLVVEINRSSDVQLNYESPEWGRMLAERKKKRAADF